MKNLTEWSKEIHKANCEKGFYDDPKNIGEILMLIVSEVSEALESHRKGISAEKNLSDVHTTLKTIINHQNDFQFKENFKPLIKDTFEDEIADTMIRCMDLCGYLNIDIQNHIEAKLRYNKTREYKHGKKY